MFRMRVALFGGTFDPIHRGHLAVATAAADAFALDQVIFAPVGLQPLKTATVAAPFADRLAMTMLAVASAAEPRFVVSGIDAPRADGLPNYTADTLTDLGRNLPQATLFALTGADSFLTLRQWRSSVKLLELAEWIVVSRPEFSLSDAQLDQLHFTPEQRARVHLLTTVHEDISATDLRHRLQAGDPCTGLIPAAVAEYIQTHHLYR